MSVTVVNDWKFLEDADMDEAMKAIREYMEHLTTNEPQLEQSLWLKTNENPLRHFHIATYSSQEALDNQIKSEGTKRFVDRLYPLIDQESVVMPAGPVIANTGTGPGEI
jgi:quinol monooxygenase YgiN